MSVTEAELRAMYLDLMRDIIINEIYKDPPLKMTALSKLKQAIGGRANHAPREDAFDQDKRKRGLDWPSMAHSMIGRERMDNLRMAACNVIENNIPGDMVETGVWRGGACIYMRAILKSYADTIRKVYVCDSFAGLPKPDDAYEADKGDTHHKIEFLAVSREQVAENFRVYDLLDDQVVFLEGWFKDTLPSAPIDAVSVLRLDGDMYESTMDALKALYPKVSPGGYVIVDDYHAVEGCRAAVHEYLAAEFPNETPEIQEIDGTGVYWIRQPSD